LGRWEIGEGVRVRVAVRVRVRVRVRVGVGVIRLAILYDVMRVGI
jgi:hypothetical protein